MNRLDPQARIGEKVAGRYRVVSELSRGGMGAVFLAVQEPLEREIALKIMLPGPAADQALRRRFIQEAQALSKVPHPNIVTIFDFGEVEDGALFIAMELVNGRNLRELLQERGPIDWRSTLAMCIGATRALVTAHAAGITHRDLKPDNIMLVGGRWQADDVKLLDFGLARTLGGGTEQLTQVNVIPGTPHYIAPERVASRIDDPRSDLYALGAIWFELLTGRLPFQGETVAAILLAHVQNDVPLVSKAVPGLKVPAEVERVIAKLLAKKPDHRWPSAQAFLADLEAIEERLTAEPKGREAAVPQAVAPAPRVGSVSRWTSSAANRPDSAVVAVPALRAPAGVGPTPPRPAVAAPAPQARSAPALQAKSVPAPPAKPAPAPAPVTAPPARAPTPRPAAPPRSAAAALPPPTELKIGTDAITVENELDAAKRRLTLVAVFRGRLVRKVEVEVPVLPVEKLPAWVATVREDFIAGLKGMLARAAPELAVPEEEPVESSESQLFFFALEAYLGGDRQTALRTVENLRQALPDDTRLANTQKKLLLDLGS